MHTRLIKENLLDSWVRGNLETAQGTIVDLVSELVKVSSPGPNYRRFPSSDSVNQTGPDGYIDAVIEFMPFVPIGKSFWEIGVGGETEAKIKRKAENAYEGRTTKIPEALRKTSTFVFVTPRSGQKGWTAESQSKWIDKKKEQGDWHDVKVIDGTQLVDWLDFFPGVEAVLAKNILGKYAKDMQPLELRWEELAMVGNPPLPPDIFLCNRNKVCDKLSEIFSGNITGIRLETRYPGQVGDFIAAYVVSTSNDEVKEVKGRCLIISSAEAWRMAANLDQPHVLIADFDIDNDDSELSRLTAIAKQAGHAVIQRGTIGGEPDDSSIILPSPKNHQIEEALRKAGYSEERSRVLSRQAAGNLVYLLRLLQNHPTKPAWANAPESIDVAFAQLLGSWDESYPSDKEVVESISGKAYDEWIEKLRRAANLPGFPLSHKERVWKFLGRYETWFALGAHIDVSHLEAFKEVAVKVLSESHPKFELPPDQHYMASVHGKELQYSKQIREGISSSLALLGSHPEALGRCSKNLLETINYEVVSGVLENADGILWASLSDLLPLLAEASPEAFLKSVEQALLTRPTPFVEVFAQESNDIFGRNYITGLLWALESLAWNAEYLVRVISILGDLAAIDPGGTWANRPKNSMWTILLPWKSHTCASLKQKEVAVRTLITEQPSVGWQLLLDLIDSSQKMTTGSFKPTWHSWIPEDWEDKVTKAEDFKQVMAYEQIAIDEAPGSTDRIIDVCDLLDKLNPQAKKSALAILQSPIVTELPDEERLGIWTKLMAVVSTHRKYADANWAMEAELVNEIAEIAETLSPSSPALLHLRLFTDDDFGLFEEGDNFEQQQVNLNRERIKAVEEVFKHGGPKGLRDFARAVESSWKLGRALGASSIDIEDFILPSLPDSEDIAFQNFIGSFAEARFRERGWEWFESLNMTGWSPAQVGLILGFLPFTDDTWLRVNELLKDHKGEYWTRASVNPYRQGGSFEQAIDSLIKYGRPYEAVDCLHAMLHDKKTISCERAIAALKSVLGSSVEGRPHNMDAYHIKRIIKALQEDPGTPFSEMIKIEWGFLRILEHEDDITPKTIETDLAMNPDSYCAVIRIMYRSKKEKKEKEPTEEEKLMAGHMWHLLNGWRIPPGTKKDGTFNGEAFDEWLIKVKESCTESGHLEAAIMNVGHVLIHAPPDPGGLWIHSSVANALNAKDAKVMRDEYSTALYNSRGTHSVDPEGKPEMELAEHYKAKAEAVELARYHRLATTLKQLANSYEREAEWIRERESLDD